MFLMSVAAYSESLFGVLGSTMVIAVGFVPVVLTTTGLIVGAAPPERSTPAQISTRRGAYLRIEPS
jgi:DHA2 family multidrug resistance protein-like MFS transporter